jgi:hypothetical protein
MYEVSVEDEAPTLIAVGALVEAWEESLPDIAARILEMPIGAVVQVMDMPLIRVHRLW